MDLGGLLIEEIQRIGTLAPFRHMSLRGGFRMSVAMTNCGERGWVTDSRGYRYEAWDPNTGCAWPRMPSVFMALARNAALAGGFGDFVPDACLINRYVQGARMTLHQDKDERDFSQPIVSVSLGLAATFLFGGAHRAEAVTRLPVSHGDVLVFGGPARLRYHGVMPLRGGTHGLTGPYRYNLTFRKAG